VADDDTTPKTTAARRPSRLRSGLVLGGVAALLVVGIPTLGRLVGILFGFDAVVMSELNACPLATEALGSPIEHTSLGLSCGSAEGSCGSGEASWTEPVVGPKGRGSYSFDVQGQDGTWVLRQATLAAGGRDLDIAQCALARRGQGVLDTTRLAGTVVSVVGPTPSPAGAACDVSIGPGGGPFGCRVVITCGGAMLYGASEHTGYTRCSVQAGPDGRRAITALDKGSDRIDGDPTLDLHTATHEVLLNDRHGAVPWAVTIRLGSGS
jgi:hypothetical protein